MAIRKLILSISFRSSITTVIIPCGELFSSGTKRFDSEKAGDREVQRTMLELLNQMDGFMPNSKIKV